MGLGGRTVRSGCVGAKAGVFPQGERLLRDGRQVLLASIGMYRHQFFAAISSVNIIEAFARHLERLRGGGILERQRMRAVRLGYIDSRAAFFGGTQLEVGIDRDIR